MGIQARVRRRDRWTLSSMSRVTHRRRDNQKVILLSIDARRSHHESYGLGVMQKAETTVALDSDKLHVALEAC